MLQPCRGGDSVFLKVCEFLFPGEPQPPLITTLPVSEKPSSVQHYVVPGAALGVAVLIALIVIVLIATRNKYKKLA